jgi:uncharacterized protein
MLLNTFCHLPGVGTRTERAIWDAGITCWEQLLGQCLPSRGLPRRTSADHIRESQEHHQAGNPAWFAGRLPSGQAWRLFDVFRDRCAFLDIETSGLSADDYVTTIALYDGKGLRTYVLGQNLEEFPFDVREYRLLVTYNGASFDLPFLRRSFDIELDQAHIDLRFVLRSLGLAGGQKRCEQRLGLEREGMEGLDGFAAVVLWHEYQWQKNARALETLLAYNAQDAINLERLMVEAYNRKLEETPFAASHRLAAPAVPANPFPVDPATVRKVLGPSRWAFTARP